MYTKIMIYAIGDRIFSSKNMFLDQINQSPMKKYWFSKIGNILKMEKNQVNSDFYVTIWYVILELGIIY